MGRYNDWLRAGRSGIESRWGRDFPPVQTGTGAHPASCKMSTESFLGVKCGRGVLLTTHPLLAPHHGRVELYLYTPSGPHRACNGITLPLPSTLNTTGCSLPRFKCRVDHVLCNRLAENIVLIWIQNVSKFSPPSVYSQRKPQLCFKQRTLCWAILIEIH